MDTTNIERQNFEMWLYEHERTLPSFERSASGDYVDPKLQRRWQRWQLHAQQRKTPPARPEARPDHAEILRSLGIEPTLDATQLAMEELRRAIAQIGVVGEIDGHDVIRRESVLDLIDRRINGNQP